MRVFTTCTVCGETMMVTDEHDIAVHPGCHDRHTPGYLESMLDRFLTAVKSGDDSEADRLEGLIDQFDRTPPRMLDAALLYASWGWPVFPLRPGGKSPLTQHGFKDATRDTTQIRRWWTSTPAANIGLPTGITFDVVDVDVPAGIFEWAMLRDSDAMPDGHGIVTTSSGGRHIYVTPSGGGNLAGLRPGIDYRGIGGFVVAPPSVRADGQQWQWTVKPSPSITAASGTVEKAA